MSQSRPTNTRITELAERKVQIAALDARRRLSQNKDEDRIKWLLGTLVFDLQDRLTQWDRDPGLWQILFPDAQENRS